MKNARLEALNLRAKTSNQRSKTENMVIAALPDDEDLDILRVICNPSHLRLRANADARVEFQVMDHREAMGLMKRFEALPMSSVRMVRRGETPTTSFYPTARVPAEWDRDFDTAEIAPALYQIGPLPGNAGVYVYLEWFTQLAGLVVNIRAYVTTHECRLTKNGVGAWIVSGLPHQGNFRESSSPDNLGPPFVTVFWSDPEKMMEALV